MPGLMQQPAKTGRSNPALDAIVKEVEAAVPENLKGEFLTIMVVGSKLMWSSEMGQDRQEFDQLITQQDPAVLVSHTVLKIVSIIQNESKRDKPLDAIGLAAPIFMAHILQYIESRHGIEVTSDLIAETAQMVQTNLMKMYGVTEQHLQELFKQRTSEQGTADGQAPVDGSADEMGEPGDKKYE